MDSTTNYYQNIAKKFFSTRCTEDGFNNNIELSNRIFSKATISSISYCYLIDFTLFLFNYEKANSHSNLLKYISIKKNELNEIIYKFKTIKTFDYNSNNWNRLRYYKTIKNIIIDYCELLNNDNDFETFNSLDGVIDYFVDAYQNFIDDGKCKNNINYPMFEDIVGLEEAKELVYEKIINPILYKDIYDKYNISVGGGILLYGLPGTGKTMFAQAVANEIDGYFVSIKSSDLKTKWYGDTESKVKELFEDARTHDISVLFFDEFESIGVSRDKHGAELTAETIVPELLAQMQGFEQNKQTVLVIAATNRPWDIDSALLRPGRFDSLVYIGLPNKELRFKILEKNLNNINVESDILDYLSSATDNYNGADLKKISDSLIRKVINKEIDGILNYEITFEDCVEVLKCIKSSVVKNDLINMINFKDYNK